MRVVTRCSGPVRKARVRFSRDNGNSAKCCLRKRDPRSVRTSSAKCGVSLQALMSSPSSMELRAAGPRQPSSARPQPTRHISSSRARSSRPRMRSLSAASSRCVPQVGERRPSTRAIDSWGSATRANPDTHPGGVNDAHLVEVRSPDGALRKALNRQGCKLAGGLGFEPRLAESESAVLPLDDPPTRAEARLS
jgi:hypothetical protein